MRLLSLILAEFIKIRWNSPTWLPTVLGAALFGGLVWFAYSNSGRGSIAVLVQCYFTVFPFILAMLSSALVRVDDGSLGIILSKPHRSRYFFAKVAALALISTFTAVVFVAALALPLWFMDDSKAAFGIVVSCAIYYLLLSCCLPLFVLLSFATRKILIAGAIVAIVFLVYPSYLTLGASEKLASGLYEIPAPRSEPVEILISILETHSRFDKAYGDLLPHSLFDRAFSRVSFPELFQDPLPLKSWENPMLFGFPEKWQGVLGALAAKGWRIVWTWIACVAITIPLGCWAAWMRRPHRQNG